MMTPRMFIPVVVLAVLFAACGGTDATSGTDAADPGAGVVAPDEGSQAPSGPDGAAPSEGFESANPDGPPTPVGGGDVAPPDSGSETVTAEPEPADFDDANPPGPPTPVDGGGSAVVLWAVIGSLAAVALAAGGFLFVRGRRKAG